MVGMKSCPKCGKEARLQPLGTVKRDELKMLRVQVWYLCTDPQCHHPFGSLEGRYVAS